MATFTSSLPDHLLERLSNLAKELQLPKNRLLEKALELYLEQLEKASYIKSYKQAATDEDILLIAEEGMQEYFNQVNHI
ncbi:ribbon-helix-helix domain-containing protein [uncultured Polaribacter sp.]|uniref:ribbon-helix-helix domain-containing protein n=1 Tax=uncultured Polaribacter sp. TaxID=174711 RepID=UPI002621692F|nr:ribbon-helix-helix domain-containing protein [uncultured Polaribacter sp.]